MRPRLSASRIGRKAQAAMELKKHVKKAVKDQEVVADVSKEDLTQSELLRVYAVKIIFTDVVFKQCNITSCYFRNCRFV
jgi:hypothetical protein